MIKFNKYFIPYIILMVAIGYKGQLIYSFGLVFIHELVHCLAARFYKFYGFDIELMIIGAVIKFRELDEASPKEDLIISISGPMVNILLCMIFYFLYIKYPSKELYMLFQGNMTIGLFNLIPAFPLDGGRILRDILNFKFIYRKSNRIMIITSIIIGTVTIFVYLILFLKGVNNFNLGIIGTFIIISSLKESERVSYIIMGDIIKKKYKFMNRGYIENRNISIYYKKELLSVMALFDKNKYNIFMVLDEEMKVMDIIYEEEIINALKTYGNITIEEFLKIENNEI